MKLTTMKLTLITRNILFTLLLLLAISDLYSQDSIQKNKIYRITLHSQSQIQNPFAKNLLRATFQHESGLKYDVAGYWSGDNIYKINFSPDVVGKWVYTTYSNNLDIKSFFSSGEFHVSEYNGENPFCRNGFPVVANSKRYLAYKNGTPFLLNAETAWEAIKNATKDEFAKLLVKRKQQGFNAVMLVANSHISLPNTGVKNQYGEFAYLDTNLLLPNPKYYDYMDTVVNMINDSNMIAMIVPIWSNMTEFFPEYTYHSKLITMEGIMNLTNYLSARYSANNVIWIAGADERFTTLLKQNYIKSVAELIKHNTANKQLVTAHTGGWSSSVDYFDSSHSWLDFHVYQSSHTANCPIAFLGAEQGYNNKPTKPILDAEGCYEDIFNNLQINDSNVRINSKFVRMARYQAFLSGAYVGITYGANGIWQWAEDSLGFFKPRFKLVDAINFDGADNCGKLIKIMNKIDWYNFTPAKELLGYSMTKYNIPISKSKLFIVAYLPYSTSYFTLRYSSFADTICFKLISPITGKIINHGAYIKSDALGKMLIRRTDPNDAVLIAYNPKYVINLGEEFVIINDPR